MKKFVVLGILFMLLLAGCAQPSPPEKKAGVTSPVKEEVKKKEVLPVFFIMSPKAGDSVSAGNVEVKMEAKDFKIGKPETANKPNEGHFHLYLDEGDYIPCASTTCVVNGVKGGDHEIKVTMHQNDHSAYSGVPAQRVKIKALEQPSFNIEFPQEGKVANPGTVKVKLSWKNFAIGKPETANKANEGHFHLFLNDGEYIACAADVCDVVGVKPGKNTIKADMHNNDHSVYPGVSVKNVTFTATPQTFRG